MNEFFLQWVSVSRTISIRRLACWDSKPLSRFHLDRTLIIIDWSQEQNFKKPSNYKDLAPGLEGIYYQMIRLERYSIGFSFQPIHQNLNGRCLPFFLVDTLNFLHFEICEGSNFHKQPSTRFVSLICKNMLAYGDDNDFLSHVSFLHCNYQFSFRYLLLVWTKAYVRQSLLKKSHRIFSSLLKILWFHMKGRDLVKPSLTGFGREISLLVQSLMLDRSIQVHSGATLSRCFVMNESFFLLFVIDLNGVVDHFPKSIRYTIYVNDIDLYITEAKLSGMMLRAYGYKFSTTKTKVFIFPKKRSL